MKTLNKSLLAAAVIGAIALPGLSSAATLSFPTSVQITHATDLIASPGIWLKTQPGLELVGTGPATGVDGTNIATIAGGDTLKVRLALTGGAQFDSGISAATVAALFVEGNQTGGGNALVSGVANAGYSFANTVLEFEYNATGSGTLAGAGDYFLQLPALNIVNLVSSLGTPGGSVGLNMTVNRDASGLQVLAGLATIARSQWGVTVTNLLSPNLNKTIDVGISNGSTTRTYFSVDGVVSNSNPSSTAGEDLYINVGGATIDITTANHTGAGSSYVNDIDATQIAPNYTVVGTANFNFTITGSNFAPWVGTGRIWLDKAAGCTHASGTSRNLTVAANSNQATTTILGSDAFFSPGPSITIGPPGPTPVYVCLAASATGNGVAMTEQDLSGTLTITNPGFSGLRIDPPPYNFNLMRLVENGTTMYFQNFNPGGNANARSILRLSNHNAFPCPVRIDAKDDLGRLSGTVVTSVPAHASENFNSNILESGVDPRIVPGGGLRYGSGKWYLRVTSECANFTGSALIQNAHSLGLNNLTPEKNNNTQWSTPTTPVP